MTDEAILDLYWSRNEDAIRETERSYGAKLHNLAWQILKDHRDAEESVGDTYMKAWQTIPPQRPTCFYAWLAKLCRNFSLGRLDWKNAAKRSAEIVNLSQELENCIPDRSMEEHLEARALGEILNRFLDTLNRENRLVFLRRYWYADSICDIAARYGLSESKVKVQLHRTRVRLKQYLQKEGITV